MNDTWFFKRAEVIRVIDGDTVELEIDLGFSIKHTIRVRLLGIDAPGKRPAKQMSSDELMRRIKAENYMVALSTIKDRRGNDRTEKYGRYLATLRSLKDGKCINLGLLLDGFAVGYEGGKR